MSVDEDTELRDLIVQSLESNGVLGKIKAELRANVFLALEGDGTFKNNSLLTNKKLLQFLSTSDGRKVVSVVREFLEFFGLYFTLSVFDPEVPEKNFLSRNELCSEFNISNADVDLPVVSEIINSFQDLRKRFHHNNHTDSVSNTADKSDSVPQNALRDMSKANSSKQNVAAHDPFYDVPVARTRSTYATIPTLQSLKTTEDNRLVEEGKSIPHAESQEIETIDECHDRARNSTVENLFSNNMKSKDSLDPIKNRPEVSTTSGNAWPRPGFLELNAGESFPFSNGSKSKQGSNQKGASTEYFSSRDDNANISADKLEAGTLFYSSEPAEFYNKSKGQEGDNLFPHNYNQGRSFDSLRNAEESLFPGESKAKEFSTILSESKPQECSDQLKSHAEESLFSRDFRPNEFKQLSAFSQKAEAIKHQSLSSLQDLPDLHIGSKIIDKQKKHLSYSASKSSDGEESAKSDYSTRSSQKSLGSTKIRYEGESHDNSEVSIEEEIEDDVSAGMDDLLSSISIGDDTTSDVTISQKSGAGGYDHIELVLPK